MLRKRKWHPLSNSALSPRHAGGFFHLLPLTLILLLAAALRFSDLDIMSTMLHHDEAAYGVDAVSLLENPRFQVYFPANNGREGLWIWLLTPLMSVFGGGALPMRMTAMLVGVLTVAAVYALARETTSPHDTRRSSLPFHMERGQGGEVALFVAAALAIQFWHVLHSHHAFRAITFPLFGSLAFAALFRAPRINRRRWWIAAGALAGLTFYTYIAARFWMIGMGALLLWWFVRHADRRRGIAVCALVWGIVCVPLVIALIQTPQTRIDQVAITSLDQLVANIGAWIGVLFNQPIYDNVHYLDGGALWSFPMAILALIGVGALVLKDRRAGLLILALLALSILPAALTDRPITLLRAIGLTIPLAFVVGIGAAALWRWGKVASVLLMVSAIYFTRSDFSWYFSNQNLFLTMEAPLYFGIDRIARDDAQSRLYFTPFRADHPVLRLRQWTLAPRPVTAFDPAVCLRLSPNADYFAMRAFTPTLMTDLEAWGSVIREDQVAYLFYRTQPDPAVFEWNGIAFNNIIEAASIDPFPTIIRASEILEMRWHFRQIGQMNRNVTAFFHLYDADALTLRAQVDAPLCPTNTPMDWGDDEVIIQTFRLTIPPDLPARIYRLAFGLYESALDGGAAGARLHPVVADEAYAVESDALILQPSLLVEANP